MTSRPICSWSCTRWAMMPPTWIRWSSLWPLIVATGTAASPAVAISATTGRYGRRQAGCTATAIRPTAASGTSTTTAWMTRAWTGSPRMVSNIGCPLGARVSQVLRAEIFLGFVVDRRDVEVDTAAGPPVPAAVASQEALVHQVPAQRRVVGEERAQHDVHVGLGVAAARFERARDMVQDDQPAAPLRRHLGDPAGGEEAREDHVAVRSGTAGQAAGH